MNIICRAMLTLQQNKGENSLAFCGKNEFDFFFCFKSVIFHKIDKIIHFFFQIDSSTQKLKDASKQQPYSILFFSVTDKHEFRFLLNESVSSKILIWQNIV